MTLYEITQEYMELLNMAEEADLDEQTLKDTFEALSGEIEAKADGYAKVIAQLKTEAEGLKTEIDRLTSRKTVIEGNIKNLKENLTQAMITTNNRKFKTALFSFNVQKNTPAVVVDVTDDAVPPMYRIPQPDKIDKEAIKKAIRSGAEINFAHLEQGESVRIR